MKEAAKVWPILFSQKQELGIVNVLQVAEIGLALPISNAEAERVFSFLWRIFTKERTWLQNKTLENILRLRCDKDFSDERSNKR